MNATVKAISRRLPLLVWGGAVLAVGVALALEHKGDTPKPPAPAPTSLTTTEPNPPRSDHFAASFAPVVKKVSPSVVKVFTTAKAREFGRSDGSPSDNPMFRWFFGPEGPGMRRGGPAPREHGIGSGVIVTKDGYILTNNHVVDGADEVKVALSDGRELTAKVIGKDSKTDVAVLKVSGDNLPHIQLADSDKIEVGDLVLAIGNPYGIGQTVTMGMVSAKGRGNMGLDYEDFIQTDAAINPGNSGGALVDTNGRLIGINTAIMNRSNGSQGIGFAIPTNLAKNVMDSLITEGHVARGYLGVLIQDVTPTLAREFRLKEKGGALVGDVTPKGPADKAGVRSGDVIVEFNGRPVPDSRQLKLLVAQAKPGSEATLKLVRDGEPHTLGLTLKELPGPEQSAKADRKASEDTGTLNGVAVADLDNRTRRELDTPPNVHGAVITDVAPDSAAYEAGLKPGDVILEINKQAVKNADDAVRLTEHPKDKTTLLRVWRDGNSRYVVVDESKGG